MKRMLLGLLLALGAVGLSGCRKCETDDRLFEALKVAIPYPEEFAAYALARSEEFDAAFRDCVTEVAAQIAEFIQDEEDFCYEVFTDPDFLNKCLIDDLNPFRIIRNNALELRDLLPLANANEWLNSSLYDILISQKNGNPQFASSNLAAINVARELLLCEDCHTSFLGL